MNDKSNSNVVVLVVEDEFLVRANTIDFLTEAGYAALEASNADEAIGILKRRNDIRIVFTDVQMPGSMNGLELAHAVCGRWPPIKVVVTSGQKLPLGGIMPSDAIFVPKPYDHRQIVSVFQCVVAS